MDSANKQSIEAKISEATGTRSRIKNAKSESGGCINDARTIELEDGRCYFVKSNDNAARDMFEKEAHGLEILGATETIRVPSVIGWQTGRNGFLVLEAIDTGRKPPNFEANFGRQLALLHQVSRTVLASECSDRESTPCPVESFGLYHDNYIGSTAQPNTWADDWVAFWREHRFGFQFELARSNGYGDGGFNRLADKLLSRLDDLLTIDEPPCLIHGDLWSGNYMVGIAGEPLLIDPAVYFAHREAEFGMTTLFGGFGPAFYQAYEDVWPLPDGSEIRIALYRLYHLLNHLNLFGSSYLNQCIEIMKKYA